MRGVRIAAVLLAAAAAVWSGACTPRRIELPTSGGTPFADANAAYDAAVQECRGARTLQAALGLSGHAGTTGLRGTVDAGFEAPDRVRLEGRHPFGRPVFILVGSGADSTLYLPRDERVLRNASTDRIVEALVGLRIGGDELRALVSGCGFGAMTAVESGVAFPNGYVAIERDGTRTFLRQIDRRWRIVAAVRPPITVHYSEFTSGRPASMRLVSDGSPASDVRVQLSDVNINVPLEPAVFQVTVSPQAEPLTLDELRRAGPLGER